MRTILMLLLLSQALQAQPARLTAFVQASDTAFLRRSWPALQAWALRRGWAVQLRKAEQGVPQGLTTTPALVCETAKGRAVYAGRYADTASLFNFCRTALLMPQAGQPLEKRHVLWRQEGRAQWAAQVKRTAWQGPALPADTASWQALAQQALAQGMAPYAWRQRASMRPTDRLFYLDLHPYRSASGEWHLSCALFSPFDCLVPIGERRHRAGSLEEAFRQAGVWAAAGMAEALSASAIGDAYSAIPAHLPDLPWEALGAPLEGGLGPSAAGPAAGMPMPRRWRYKGAAHADVPALQFAFLEPLSRYAGEVSGIAGGLEASADSLGRGRFEVDVPSLTMGLADLDAKVLKSYLKAKRYPKAALEWSPQVLEGALAWGRPAQARFPARLQLLQQWHPVMVQAVFTPFSDASGRAAMLVEAQFRADLSRYGIDGPDGPSPARNTLQFHAYFLLEGN